MRSLRRALLGIGAAGAAAGIVAIVIVLSSEHQRDERALNLALGPVVGWAFIGAGLVAWWRRPTNRFGSLMTLIGFAWFAGSLSVADAPGLFIVGVITSPWPFAMLLHLLLAFPTGRVDGRRARTLIGAGYVDVGVVLPLGVLFADTTKPDICDGCPPNPLLVAPDSALADVFLGIYLVLTLAVLSGVVILLFTRWRRAPQAQRRLLGPLYLTGGTTIVAVVLSFVAREAAGDSATIVISAVSIALLATVPFAFLWGLLRTRLAQSGAVAEIVRSSGGDLRDALAGGLGDPSLELAYYLPDRDVYVDRDGQVVGLPQDGGRAATLIEHEGRRIAAIVHDPALNEQPGLVEAAGAAAALALENERLDAELRARVEELSASRARIVEAGLAERRRLERDLHDGAQQRLVALRLQLRLARDRVGPDPDAAQDAGRGDAGARRGARGVARAGPRDPPRGAGRPRPGARPVRPRRPRTPARRSRAVTRRAAAGTSRGGRLLRSRGSADQRRPVRAGVPRERRRRAAQRPRGGRGARRRGRRRRPRSRHRAHGSGRPPVGARRAPGSGVAGRRRDPRTGGHPVRVVVADDSVLMRRGVVSVLESAGFEVVAQAGDADDLVRKVGAHRPDVAVVDVRMPPDNTDDGLRAAIRLRSEHPGLRVLVLSQYVEPDYAQALLADTAEGVGYLLKDRVSDVEHFVEAVQRVAGGGSALDPEVVSQLVGRHQPDSPVERLTPREREVLGLMAEGRSNAAIAAEFTVSERAVEKHVTSIFGKLGLAPAPADHRRVLAVLAYLRG